MNQNIATQNPELNEKALLRKIEIAQKIAESRKMHFSDYQFETLAEFDGVKVNLPSTSAPQMRAAPKNSFLIFNQNLSGLRKLDVAAHYKHNDFCERQNDGTVRPTVIRHFYVKPKYFGTTITACIKIGQTTSLSTGKKTIMIDVSPSAEYTEPEYKLRLGVTPLGKEGEAMIPGQEKCIRVEKIREEANK